MSSTLLFYLDLLSYDSGLFAAVVVCTKHRGVALSVVARVASASAEGYTEVEARIFDSYGFGIDRSLNLCH